MKQRVWNAKTLVTTGAMVAALSRLLCHCSVPIDELITRDRGDSI